MGSVFTTENSAGLKLHFIVIPAHVGKHILIYGFTFEFTAWRQQAPGNIIQ